jgi:hypothetical protein
MDLRNITITQEEIDAVLSEALPASPASFSEDATSLYWTSRPLVLTAVAILHFVYPPAAGAIQALVAILDKACKEEKNSK